MRRQASPPKGFSSVAWKALCPLLGTALSFLVFRREGLLAGWAPSAGAATPFSGPCLCLRGGKAQSSGPSRESMPVQPPPALLLVGIPLLSSSQDDAPLSKGRPVLVTSGDSRGEDGALPCPPHVPHSLRHWAVEGWEAGAAGTCRAPLTEPLTEPRRPASLPSARFGSDSLPSAPWKLYPVSPLHLWCYSIIPTFEMRQVQRGEVACSSQLASKGRSPDRASSVPLHSPPWDW